MIALRGLRIKVGYPGSGDPQLGCVGFSEHQSEAPGLGKEKAFFFFFNDDDDYYYCSGK